MIDSTYFSEVGRHKLLTRDEEINIARLAKAGNKAAREKLILSNMRLAIKIAKEFHNKSKCSLDDLIQESNVGLCKAVDLFDPDKGFKFSTYASWWMKQCVRSHILGNTGIARLPGNARMLIYQIKQKTNEYEEEFGRSPTLHELADMLGVSPSVLDGVSTCSNMTVNLDARVSSSSDGSRAFHDTIEDENAQSVDELIDRDRLIDAVYKSMSTLTPREEIVLRLRFGLIDDLRQNEEFNQSRLILEENSKECE
jgi:RNA polymerase primary sigma factor